MTVDQDKIRQRAHDLWVSGGRPDGRDVEFWLQAEAELAKAARKPAAAKPVKAKAPAAPKAAPAKSGRGKA